MTVSLSSTELVTLRAGLGNRVDMDDVGLEAMLSLTVDTVRRACGRLGPASFGPSRLLSVLSLYPKWDPRSITGS